MVGCVSSMAAKKSITASGLPFVAAEVDVNACAGIGGGDEAVEALLWLLIGDHHKILPQDLRLSEVFFDVELEPPFRADFSAASLLVLYSMRFCSKLGSSRYS